MVKTKRYLMLLLAVVMVIQTMVIPTFAAKTEDYIDFPVNSWSTEAMTAAVENGLITGTSDTTIEPNKNLTRAEFAAIITRAFGATEMADIANFADVSKDAWYYDSVAKAVQMGVMNGTGGTTFAPDTNMKREEVILAMARVLYVDGEDSSVLNQFSDRDDIDSWATKAVAGMVAEGYINGYEDGTIRPLRNITRAELAQMFHNIFKTYISEAGTYENVASEGSVIVRAKDVTLKNVTVNGDLVMADGIGDGDFHLENVTVKGKILARGGEGTVYFVNVKSEGTVIINDPNGVVNFHNYRDEEPFVNNLLENTKATFLERTTTPSTPSTGSTGGGGGVSYYDLVFYDEDRVTVVDSVDDKKSSYVITEDDVPTDAQMEKQGFTFEGWTKKNSIDVKSRDYFIGKKISVVKGDWYPYYVSIGTYTITFYDEDGVAGTPVEKLETESLALTDVPTVTPADTTKKFVGWTTTQGSDTVEYTNDELTADVVANVFGSTTVNLYPVIVDKDKVAYKTEYYFEQSNGEYVSVISTTLYEIPGTVVTAEALATIPEGYEENTAHADRVASATVLADGTTTLKLYYNKIVAAPETYTVTFYDEDGVAGTPVEKLETESLALTDVPTVTPADTTKKFVGWTTTQGSDTVEYTNDELTAATVSEVFNTTTVNLYPVIVDKDKVAYKTEYYFERVGGTYVKSLTTTIYEFAGTNVEAMKIIPSPEGYVENTTHADRIFEATVAEDGTTVLRLYYALSATIVTAQYKIEYYFEQDGGSYVRDDNYTITDMAEVGAVVTAPVLITIPEGYEENTTHADRLLSAAVAKDGSTVLKRYYKKQVAEFTVEYYFEQDGGSYVRDDNYTVVDSAVVGTVVTAPELSTIPEGYEENTAHADRVASATVLADGSTTLKLYYNKIVVVPTEAEYTTEYYFEQQDGSYILDATYTSVLTGTIGETVNAVIIVVADYEENTAHADRVASATVLADGSTTLKLYYNKIVAAPETYTITFYDRDGLVGTPVAKLESESINVGEIPGVAVEATEKFVGWTITLGSDVVNYTNEQLTAGTVSEVFNTTAIDLYPVIVNKDAVQYKTEYYFEDLDGNYAIDDVYTITQYITAGTVVNAAELGTIPEGFEATTHADEIRSASVAEDGTTVLKLYYKRLIITVEYYDLAYDSAAQLVYNVKYGGTIDNFVDPADETKTNAEIKTEIEEYIEYLVMFGYGKDYDDAYLYNKFEDKLGGNYYLQSGKNGQYEHELNYNWYVEDTESSLGYEIFDETHVFTEDLDLYAKLKRIRIEINLPASFAGIDIPAIGRTISLLTPYENITRAIDHARDMLVMNAGLIKTGIDKTEIEPKLYNKLANVEIRGSSFINEDRELVETNLLIYFYEMMGGKDSFKSWMWDVAEKHLFGTTIPEGSATYNLYWAKYRPTQPNDETALINVFEKDALKALDPDVDLELARDGYIASKNFIYQATEEDKFDVNPENEFIMKKVYERLDGLRSFDAMLEEFVGDKIPEGLMNRLPMDVIKNIYEPRVEKFLDELNEARENGSGSVDSGILFDVNTATEILIPIIDWINDTYEAGVDKIVKSDNRVAELAKKYYVDNPYATGIVDGYLDFDRFFEDEDGDGLYNIKSFSDIYDDVIMPLSVETADATLWYFDNVDYSRIAAVLEDAENEKYILAVTNHINTIMSDYAEDGLPETMSDYYDDLISDPVVYDAIQKIDNKVSYEMMNFVETKIQNATLQTLYAKVLAKFGIPAETVLAKYTGSGAYKTYTHADYVNYLEELEKSFEKTADNYDVGYPQTTDKAFDKAHALIGDDDNEISVTYGGFNVVIEREIVDDLYS